ncbi:DUF4321 domain-containing protein [Alkalibaculum sp. M08DMB]|uniref:DUF4321 domain-containing protein n=1 Tax=Alkalibaculum sporogenes TaxID=2655001 RepID=A0A6A7K5T4_9FIRM|nr:DUF4321 domain-containing protein [Alkalibaculum sporogenes]MPW24839.1 DUF4321 domain-containing protein [Alkalibaculum sporogenes]
MKLKKGNVMLVLIVIFSLVIGNFVGELISEYLSIFGRTINISILSDGAPWIIDLSFLRFAFGLVINLNLGSIIFLILGLIIFYRN